MKKFKFLHTLAYIIPLSILLFVLYVNYLPFGYDKTISLEVGSRNDTTGLFYLEETDSLSSRQTKDGATFRTIEGLAKATYQPIVPLRNTKVKATLEGDAHFPTLPSMDFTWDHHWSGDAFNDFDIYKPKLTYEQFLEGKETEVINFDSTFAIFLDWTASNKDELVTGELSLKQNEGEIFLSFEDKETVHELADDFFEKGHNALVGFAGDYLYFFLNEELITKEKIVSRPNDIQIQMGEFLEYEEKQLEERVSLKNNCAYFDGDTRLVLPNTIDDFEKGPFAIYLEWVPQKQQNSQQLFGHYNWDIFQNAENITFRIGRTTVSDEMYSVAFDIDEEFFGERQSLLALYNPNVDDEVEGYIKVFVNGIFVKRQNIGNEEIKTDHDKDDLTLGWTTHGGGAHPYFEGEICEVRFSYKMLEPGKTKIFHFQTDGTNNINIPLVGEGDLNRIILELKK